MILTDTHAHLYLKEFSHDRQKVITTAIEKNVRYILLPNIDSSTIGGMLNLCDMFPKNCFPMIGLHPTSVKSDFKDELKTVEQWLEKRKFYAIGEIGIDLYWDKSFAKEQEIAFRHQINLAKKNNLPIVIHSRYSFIEIHKIVKDLNTSELTGVFHCFTGSLEEANKIIDLGFMLGIGGVLTFKNSGLDKIVEKIDLKHIILETDSPYLTPVPFRGKRNESAYISYIAEKLAEIKNISIKEVAEITTKNAMDLFKIRY